MNLKVHLVFAGNCEEALVFYKDTLGGRIEFIFRKKDEDKPNITDADKEKISHMIIKTPHFELAGEDLDSDKTLMVGNNNKLVLVFPEVEECRKVFNLFAEKGTITMPFEKTFFCDGIGEITDNYGITWLIMVTDEGYES